MWGQYQDRLIASNIHAAPKLSDILHLCSFASTFSRSNSGTTVLLCIFVNILKECQTRRKHSDCWRHRPVYLTGDNWHLLVALRKMTVLSAALPLLHCCGRLQREHRYSCMPLHHYQCWSLLCFMWKSGIKHPLSYVFVQAGTGLCYYVSSNVVTDKLDNQSALLHLNSTAVTLDPFER